MLREDEECESKTKIPNKVIPLKLFLDHFWLQKSQGEQELTNPVTPVSHNYKRGVYEEMFYQHNVNVTLLVAEWRRVAQSGAEWRRVAQSGAEWRSGPITQRSEDQNLALLSILLLIKRMSEDV